jgi:glycosyltransferase involved in cell wall biosynthesis
LVRLWKKRPNQFEFVFSGGGPEKRHIDTALETVPELGSVVRFDNEFETWTDRLRPFRYSSVFVYPCTHTGWGLVIPEAMAAGMAVVGARGAESLRYFVRHRVNGVVIQPNVDELTREMDRCIADPAEVARMGARARIDARDGHAPVVAERVANALRRVSRRPRGRLTSALARVGQLAGRVRGA